MDDISLIAHMTGGGEELERNLRDKGFTDLNSIIGETREDLANKLGIGHEIAAKIISAAKAIYKANVTLEAVESSKKREKKAKNPRIMDSKKTKPVQKHAKPLIRRYWKKLLPIVCFTLIGFWLTRRG